MEPSEQPHLALFVVLSYLPLHQILLMSQVCKSLRDAIAEDDLVWLDIIVESPLNIRLTDEILMRITSKAHGRLRTLALLNCTNITDDGLLEVVKANPFISKIYVPACIGLTQGGVLRMVTTLTENISTKLTTVKVNGIYNFTQEDLQTLHSKLPMCKMRKFRFYNKYNTCSFRSLNEDDCPIDVEICAKCKDVKLVFDCPRETCMRKLLKGHIECRGCSLCIPRCESCGRCIVDEDDEQGETICNDTLCLECWLSIPKCNHCNKSFCPRHAKLYNTESCIGFVCDICHEKSLL